MGVQASMAVNVVTLPHHILAEPRVPRKRNVTPDDLQTSPTTRVDDDGGGPSCVLFRFGYCSEHIQPMSTLLRERTTRLPPRPRGSYYSETLSCCSPGQHPPSDEAVPWDEQRDGRVSVLSPTSQSVCLAVRDWSERALNVQPNLRGSNCV